MSRKNRTCKSRSSGDGIKPPLGVTPSDVRIFSDSVALIPHDVLLPWESALYGAVMLGWGVTLLLVGRVTFRRNDPELKRALVLGLAAWLAVEAAASAWFGVWFNVGVDLVVLFLFGIPLLSTGSQPRGPDSGGT